MYTCIWNDFYQRSAYFPKVNILFPNIVLGSQTYLRIQNFYIHTYIHFIGSILHTHIHTFHREYAGRSENEYSSGLFLHDLTRGRLLDAVRERVSGMTPAQCWIRPPNVSFKGEPGSVCVHIVFFLYSPI